MSSKAFYKSLVEPKLFHKVQKHHDVAGGRRQLVKSIEVWTTTCIVMNFGKSTCQKKGPHCSVLINPGNPQMTGASEFPYFPRGGPVPRKVDSMHKDWQPLGFVSQWGGMEVGNGMLFPVSVVDGLVHQMGGSGLKLECAWKRAMAMATSTGKDKDPCPVGHAVMTSAGTGPLKREYNSIIHITPPFYRAHSDTDGDGSDDDDHDPLSLLERCYASALEIVAASTTTTKKGEPESPLRVASPLLGAGARGFPYDKAIDIASKVSVDWMHQHDDDGIDVGNDNIRGWREEKSDVSLVFGVLEEAVAEQLARAMTRG